MSIKASQKGIKFTLEDEKIEQDIKTSEAGISKIVSSHVINGVKKYCLFFIDAKLKVRDVIFIDTVFIYPKGTALHKENKKSLQDNILEDVKNFYGKSRGEIKTFMLLLEDEVDKDEVIINQIREYIYRDNALRGYESVKIIIKGDDNITNNESKDEILNQEIVTQPLINLYTVSNPLLMLAAEAVEAQYPVEIVDDFVKTMHEDYKSSQVKGFSETNKNLFTDRLKRLLNNIESRVIKENLAPLGFFQEVLVLKKIEEHENLNKELNKKLNDVQKDINKNFFEQMVNFLKLYKNKGQDKALDKQIDQITDLITKKLQKLSVKETTELNVIWADARKVIEEIYKKPLTKAISELEPDDKLYFLMKFVDNALKTKEKKIGFTQSKVHFEMLLEPFTTLIKMLLRYNKTKLRLEKAGIHWFTSAERAKKRIRKLVEESDKEPEVDSMNQLLKTFDYLRSEKLREKAGKPVSTAEFWEEIEKSELKETKELFDVLKIKPKESLTKKESEELMEKLIENLSVVSGLDEARSEKMFNRIKSFFARRNYLKRLKQIHKKNELKNYKVFFDNLWKKIVDNINPLMDFVVDYSLEKPKKEFLAELNSIRKDPKYFEKLGFALKSILIETEVSSPWNPYPELKKLIGMIKTFNALWGNKYKSAVKIVKMYERLEKVQSKFGYFMTLSEIEEGRAKLKAETKKELDSILEEII